MAAPYETEITPATAGHVPPASELSTLLEALRAVRADRLQQLVSIGRVESYLTELSPHICTKLTGWLCVCYRAIFEVPSGVPGTADLLTSTALDPGGLSAYFRAKNANCKVTVETVTGTGTGVGFSSLQSATASTVGAGFENLSTTVSFAAGTSSGSLIAVSVYFQSLDGANPAELSGAAILEQPLTI